MKLRTVLPALALLLAVLTGCFSSSGGQTSPPEPTPAAPAPVPEPPAQIPSEAPAEPVIRIPYPALGSHTPGAVWDESVFQNGYALTPEPGDTQYTYDYGKLELYPPDEACSDAELLAKWLDVEGLTPEELEIRGCEQLILSVAKANDGIGTLFTCYEKQPDGTWVSVEGLRRIEGWGGYNGVAHGRTRGTKTTPAGLWSLGLAFGIQPMPEGLRMPWRDVTAYSDWVADENSVYFNTWQERNDPNVSGGWDESKTEHLENYRFYYDYCCVIRFNAPPYMIPQRGGAIFLHCSDTATAGCLGMPKQNMLDVLLWLDPARSPYIFITGSPKPQ